MFSDLFVYGKLNGDVFNFRSLPDVLPVSQKHWKTVTSTNICLLVPYNCQPRCFFLPIHVRRFFWSYFQLPVITGSTSSFLKNIKTRNLEMFSEQFEYAEFNEDILNFRLWLPVMSSHFRFVENNKKAWSRRCFWVIYLIFLLNLSDNILYQF